MLVHCITLLPADSFTACDPLPTMAPVSGLLLVILFTSMCVACVDILTLFDLFYSTLFLWDVSICSVEAKRFVW